MDQIKQPLPLTEQLNRAYNNLHPSYRQHVSREHFVSFQELQQLGIEEELRRAQVRAYHMY